MNKITLKHDLEKDALIIGFWYSDEEKELLTTKRDVNYYALKKAFAELVDIIHKHNFLFFPNPDEKEFYARELHFSLEEREDFEVILIDNLSRYQKALSKNIRTRKKVIELVSKKLDELLNKERDILLSTLKASKISVDDSYISQSIPIVVI